MPPSLRHRVDTTFSMADRLCRWAPVTEIHVESVAFDTHSLIAGRLLPCSVQQGQRQQAGRDLPGASSRLSCDGPPPGQGAPR
ncbi:RRXRR domain-containing protein [Streptomyces sp. NPDC007991]|uniref:RRXRR domain-containing protein n=1 Tax=Streptomyces sp. NPDC007991 TaxID=3364803 RepID=UPI0036E6137B